MRENRGGRIHCGAVGGSSAIQARAHLRSHDGEDSLISVGTFLPECFEHLGKIEPGDPALMNTRWNDSIAVPMIDSLLSHLYCTGDLRRGFKPGSG